MKQINDIKFLNNKDKKMRYSKYNAKKTEYNGVMYDSRKEARRAWELDMLLKAGEIQGLIRQPRFKLKYCTYIADFAYTTKDGEYIVEDVKGFKTDIYKLKKKMLKAEYGIEVREI